MTEAQLTVLGDSLREAGLDELAIKRMLAAINPSWVSDCCLRVGVNVRQHCRRLAGEAIDAPNAEYLIDRLDLAPIIDSVVGAYSNYSLSSYVKKYAATLGGPALVDEDEVEGSSRRF